MKAEEISVWVRSDLAHDGVYIATLETSQDFSMPLDEAAAMTYARYILWSVAAAEYDAAVLAQVTALGDERLAGGIIPELRARRQAPTAVGPLTLVPGVSQSTRQAFLVVLIDGRRVGQWAPDQARGHALGILQAVEVAAMDNAYKAVLMESVGLPEAVAHDTVDGLAEFRPRWE